MCPGFGGLNIMTEQEIISGSIRQDQAALKKLFETYYGKVMGISLRYSETEEQAKEIMKRSFEEIYANLWDFSQEKNMSFQDWVKNIVIRNAVRVSREDKSHYRIVSTVVAPEGEKKVEVIDDEKLLQSINRENLILALRKLSPAFRLAYNLHEVDNVSVKDILQLLDISEGTFKSNLSQAGFHLKKALLHL